MTFEQTFYAGISLDRENSTYYIDTSARTEDIQTILSAINAPTTIEFSSGVHNLTSTLSITDSNVTVRGAGQSETTLSFSATNIADGLSFRGKIDSSFTSTLQDAVARDSTTITVENANGLKAGDVLMISQQNDAAFLASGIYDNVKDSLYMKENPLRESIVEIDHVDGNTIYLKHNVAYDMEAGAATVQRLNMLHNITLSDMTVTYDLGTPDANDFSNTLPDFAGTNAVLLNYTQAAVIQNLAVVNAPSHGVTLQNALEAQVDNLFVDGAHNKGGDGNGYGFNLSGSFYSTATGLEIINTRHAVLFSSWHAEAYNTIQVDFTNRDINYHGSDDHSNTVIVDRSVYVGSDTQAWALVSPGSIMHPYTDISANTNLFAYAVGGFNNDKITGIDSGAELYGRAGSDILLGGVGSDILAGGTDADILTGGAGQDLFVYTAGDGEDIITDFAAGAFGDTLVLRGYAGLLKISDLTVVQDGADAEITLFRANGIADIIHLQGVQWADISPENIVIEAAVATAQDVTLSAATDIVRAGDGSDDIVHTTISRLSVDDVLALGSGQDTLQITTANFTLDTMLYSGITGVDILDVTQAVTARLIMSQSFLNASDTGRITVNYGTFGIDRLTAAYLADGTDVVLHGAGAVTLGDNVANRVVIDSMTTGSVTGLKGQDSFVIESETTAALNGGAGNDSFIFTSDTLTNSMRINGGDGIDTVRFLSAVTVTVADLQALSSVENLEFAVKGSQISYAGWLPVLNGGAVQTALTMKSDFAGSVTLGSNLNLTVSSSQSMIISLTNASSRVTGGTGADTIAGSAGADKISGGGGNDILIGGLGNDSLTGGSGRDTFRMTLGDGKDSISDFQVGPSGDALHLTGYYHLNGLGDMTLTQEGADTRVILNAKDSVLLKGVLATTLTADNFSYDNSVILNVSLRATTGVDRLISGGGVDTLDAYVSTLGAGDVIGMGAGVDTLRFLTARFGFDFTTLASISGVDVLDLSQTTSISKMVISREMVAGSDNGILTVLYSSGGLMGLDTSRVDASRSVVLQGGPATIGLADGVANRITLNPGNGVTVLGGTGDDYVRVRTGSATLNGGDGADTFSVGGAGTWHVSGGNGNDVFQFSSTAFFKAQMVSGGAGSDELRLYDTANLDAADLANVSGLEKITFYGTGNILQLTSALFDTQLELRGSGAQQTLTVDATSVAADKIIGVGELLNVMLNGLADHAYTVRVTTSLGATVTSTTGHDTIVGGGGIDRLNGNDGADVMTGGRGADILTGGAGADTFVFTASTDFGDHITDFSSPLEGGGDMLDMTAIFDYYKLGSLTADIAWAQGYLAVQEQGTDTVVLFDRDASKSTYAPVVVATLEHNNATLLGHDFILI